MNKQTVTRIAVAAIVILGFAAVALASIKNGDDMSSMESMDTSQRSSGNEASRSGQMTESNQVTYRDFAVIQKNIKVKKGTTVTWTNEDSAKHDVTPETETDDFKASKLFGKGEAYSVTFNTVGTFGYYCSPHPYMKGTVEVTE